MVSECQVLVDAMARVTMSPTIARCTNRSTLENPYQLQAHIVSSVMSSAVLTPPVSQRAEVKASVVVAEPPLGLHVPLRARGRLVTEEDILGGELVHIATVDHGCDNALLPLSGIVPTKSTSHAYIDYGNAEDSGGTVDKSWTCCKHY